MWNPLSWVMETAAIMAIALANDRGKPPDWQDFVGIITLHVINSTINFIKENNAGNAAAALMACLAPKAKVILQLFSVFSCVLCPAVVGVQPVYKPTSKLSPTCAHPLQCPKLCSNCVSALSKLCQCCVQTVSKLSAMSIRYVHLFKRGLQQCVCSRCVCGYNIQSGPFPYLFGYGDKFLQGALRT